MALKTNKLAAATAVAAALSLLATPVSARDYYGRYRHHDNGIDTGDVIAGVVLLGAIAAIAGAADRHNDGQVREALAEPVRMIVQAVRDGLERIPPELSADVYDRGIVLSGGGALLQRLDDRLRRETGLPVSVAEDPLSSVVLGAGKMLSDFALLRKVSID